MDEKRGQMLHAAGTGERGAICNCRNCIDARGDTVNGWPRLAGEMVVCATCGCKRCPHATDHGHSCTDSNNAGQLGSVYGREVCTGCTEPGMCTKTQKCLKEGATE